MKFPGASLEPIEYGLFGVTCSARNSVDRNRKSLVRGYTRYYPWLVMYLVNRSHLRILGIIVLEESRIPFSFELDCNMLYP